MGWRALSASVDWRYGWGRMVEILKSFEQAAAWFRPIVLVLPGLAATALGLFVWLGGLGFRRLLLAVLGAVIGALIALALLGQNPAAMVLTGLVGTFIAVVFQRFFAAALLSAQGGFATFLIVGWSYLAVPQGALAGQLGPTPEGRTLTVQESLDVARAYTLDISDTIKQAGRQLTAARWAIVTAVAFTLLMTGLLFRQLGGALSCAILGTAMIFGGLVLLLMFKGSAPVTRMAGQPTLLGTVFLTMTLFGTLEQWTLCRRADKRSEAEAPSKKKSGARKGERGKRTWRDR